MDRTFRAQKLIKLRNKLMNTYSEIERLSEKNATGWTFKKIDTINCITLAEKLKGTKFLEPHYLYNIPKKTTKGDVYDAGELTE